MATFDKSPEVDRVACAVCLKEVPITEAKIAEATDYFVHFCGLECYQQWKNQRAAPSDPAGKPGS